MSRSTRSSRRCSPPRCSRRREAFFVLDETGTALAGKVAASLFSALAAAVLFLALGRRYPTRDAAWAAIVFALGTSVWSTSQALWQHPAAVLFLSVAVLFWLKADDGERHWAGRAGLPLALALAARPADVALVAVLGLAFALRWPRAAAPAPPLGSWPRPVRARLSVALFRLAPASTGSRGPSGASPHPGGKASSDCSCRPPRAS